MKNRFLHHLSNSIKSTAFSVFVFFVFFTSSKSLATFGYCLLISGMYSFVMGFSLGYFNDYLRLKLPWSKFSRKRLVYSTLGNVFLTVLMVEICNYINMVCIQGVPVSSLKTPLFYLIQTLVVFVSLFICAAFNCYYLYLNLKKQSESLLALERKNKELAVLQLIELRNQLDPHFLFNSLNVLAELIHQDVDKSEQFIESLSKTYRYVLTEQEQSFVSLKKEIDFAKSYAELLQIRMGKSLEVVFSLEQADFSQLMFPLSLQLLLENCIKHNIATQIRPLSIRVFAKKEALVVENNFQPKMNKSQASGFGLANIQKRYELLSDKQMSIQNTETVFRVELPLLNWEEIEQTQDNKERI